MSSNRIDVELNQCLKLRIDQAIQSPSSSHIYLTIQQLHQYKLYIGEPVYCISASSSNDLVQCAVAVIAINQQNQQFCQHTNQHVVIDEIQTLFFAKPTYTGYEVITSELSSSTLHSLVPDTHIYIVPTQSIHNQHKHNTVGRVSARLCSSITTQHTHSDNAVYYLKSQLYSTFLFTGCYITHNTDIYYVYDTSAGHNIGTIDHSTNILLNSKLDTPSSEYRESSHGPHESRLTNPSLISLYNTLKLRVYHNNAFTQLGVQCARGVLLYGPPGVGKTYSVNTVCSLLNLQIISVNGSMLINSQNQHGNNQSPMQVIFDNAIYQLSTSVAGVVIFIDELDIICSQRNNESSINNHMTSQLIACMDRLKQHTDKQITVVGATNYVNSIDLSLRCNGRFDREICINVPNSIERLNILQHYTNELQLSDDVILSDIADKCIGYVGADIQSLCKQASLYALREYRSAVTLNTSIQCGVLSLRHFNAALIKMSASSQRGLYTPHLNKHTLSFDRIGGLHSIKSQLIQSIEWPLLHYNTFKRLGIRPSRGVLLYGPPGCAKTTLVRALAAKRNTSFFYCDSASVYSSYMGESEKYISSLFDRARSNLPAIIFLDELDSIVGKRGAYSNDSSGNMEARILSQLLAEMDGVQQNSGLIVVAATNRLYAIDDALLRPGRLDSLIYVPPPDMEARKQILHAHTQHTPLSDDVDLQHIASATDMYSGADLQNLVREACMCALRDGAQQQCVTNRHFQLALMSTQPSLNQDILQQYNQSK